MTWEPRPHPYLTINTVFGHFRIFSSLSSRRWCLKILSHPGMLSPLPRQDPTCLVHRNSIGNPGTTCCIQWASSISQPNRKLQESPGFCMVDFGGCLNTVFCTSFLAKWQANVLRKNKRMGPAESEEIYVRESSAINNSSANHWYRKPLVIASIWTFSTSAK